MAVSIVPTLIDALVTQSRAALPDVNVYDGYGVTNDYGDYLMVGVDDPDSSSYAPSMSQTQVMATAGTPRSRDEEGTVPNVIYCFTGDSGDAAQKAVRVSAYAALEAVAGILRADPSLGITAPAAQVMVCQIGTVTLDQLPDERGTAALITFTVAFMARI